MTQKPMGYDHMVRSSGDNRRTDSLSAFSLFALALVLALSLTACTTIKKEGFKPNEHIGMVNGDGELIDPRANFLDPESGYHLWFKPYSILPGSSANTQAGSGHNQGPKCRPGTPPGIFCELFASILKNAPYRAGTNKRRIVLFVHGGMNSSHQSIQRAADYSSEILADATDGAYPIFINWDSSLTSSYLDHLINLRQGRVAQDWCCGAWMEEGGWRRTIGSEVFGHVARVFTIPPYLLMDVVRGAIRLPVDIYGVYAEMLSTKWRGDRREKVSLPYPWPDAACADDRYIGITPRADRLLCDYWHNKESSHPIVQGFNWKTDTETRAQVGFAVLTFPFHVASGLLIDAAGTGSWSAMYRRTAAMFNQDKDSWSSNSRQTPTGGIAQFMSALQDFLNEHRGKDEWEVVLIGHSMGTIVVNEMVRQFGHPLESDHHHRPLFDKIVYMAAACSLRDYLNTIPHYLGKV